MNIKIETWAGHQIRFVEKETGEWWAVAKDVALALEYAKPENAIKRHCKYTPLQGIPHPQNPNKILEVNIISETDIYIDWLLRVKRKKQKNFKTGYVMLLKSCANQQDLKDSRYSGCLIKTTRKKLWQHLTSH